MDSHVSAESVGDFLKPSRHLSGEFPTVSGQWDCGIVEKYL